MKDSEINNFIWEMVMEHRINNQKMIITKGGVYKSIGVMVTLKVLDEYLL